jgi:large subunit ribosomal protein L22
MTVAKAKLSTYRQSPRKVRLMADLVRGKKVEEALTLLNFTAKRNAEPIGKLISSALANAKDLSLPLDNLIVKEIMVDSGKTLYRRRPMSRGRAFVIRKRTSHIAVTLAESTKKPKVKKINTKQSKSEAKPEESPTINS